MELKKILILNYRCCREIDINLTSNDPTVLIGINDSGKSTVLDGVSLLLSSSPSFNFSRLASARSDLSNTPLARDVWDKFFQDRNLPALTYSETAAAVLGQFAFTDEEVSGYNEEELSEQLLWSIESASGCTLWFARRLDQERGTSEDLLLIPDGIEQNYKELWNLKAKDLTLLKKALKLTDEEIVNVNKRGRFRKIEIIRAIYSRCKLKHQWVPTKFKDIHSVFPIVQTLGWQTTLDELKRFADGIMKSKIDSHLSSLRERAGKLAVTAQRQINKELESLRTILQEDLPNVTGIKSRILFDVNSKITDIFLNKNDSDGDIHLETQGEGIKRQIWFALIKWVAFRDLTKDSVGKRFLWCFDEPETHLFPAAQRSFFEAIKKLAKTSVQCVISTHSTVFIDRTNLDLIRSMSLRDGYSQVFSCTSVDEAFEVLQVRNSDFLFFDRFLLVEGETEKTLVSGLFKLDAGKSLEECGVQIVPLGGKSERRRNHDNITKLLRNFQKADERIITLLDNDAFLSDENNTVKGANIFYVGKQDIDDAIPSSVWLLVLKAQVPEIEVNEGEIEHLKAGIPNDKSIPSSKKFYPRLKALFVEKTGTDEGLRETVIDRFPQKGAELGRLLVAGMKKANAGIPAQIKTVFKAL